MMNPINQLFLQLWFTSMNVCVGNTADVYFAGIV